MRPVSIIIPCYNAEAWIAETIESCLAQTYRPIEIIVVDDGSTDASLSIIQSFGDKVKYVTGPNQGLPFARNRGLEISEGDYVLFLDADDLVAQDHISTMVNALDGKEDSIAVSRWWRLEQRSEDWVHTQVGLQEPPNGDPIAGILGIFLHPSKGWGVPLHAVLWPHSVMAVLGGSDIGIPNATEVDCFLQALVRGVQVVHVKGGGAYHRYYGTSSRSLSARGSNTRAKSLMRIFTRLEDALQATGQLDRYRTLLGQVYFSHAHMCIVNGYDRLLARESLRRARQLAGDDAITVTGPPRILIKLVGLENKEKLTRLLARLGIANQARREFMRAEKSK